MSPFTVTRYGHSRFWAVRDTTGELVCVCVYKRGAQEVVRRLGAKMDSTGSCFHDGLPVEPPETGREPVRGLLEAAVTGE